MIVTLISVAAIARTGNAIGWFDHKMSLSVAGLAWIAAFALFGLLFLPKLMRPRADGQLGQ